MSLPSWQPQLRPILQKLGLDWLWNWWQDFRSFFTTRMDTQGDVTLTTAAKGIVLTNAAGTKTKRIRLNNAGDGIIIEDL